MSIAIRLSFSVSALFSSSPVKMPANYCEALFETPALCPLMTASFVLSIFISGLALLLTNLWPLLSILPSTSTSCTIPGGLALWIKFHRWGGFPMSISYFATCGKAYSLLSSGYCSLQIQPVYLLSCSNCLFQSLPLPVCLLAPHVLLRSGLPSPLATVLLPFSLVIWHPRTNCQQPLHLS